jgi:hypothetical protein
MEMIDRRLMFQCTMFTILQALLGQHLAKWEQLSLMGAMQADLSEAWTKNSVNEWFQVILLPLININ